MNLGEALNIFDDVDEIKLMCISNIQHVVTNTPHQSTGMRRYWLEYLAEKTGQPITELESELRKRHITEAIKNYQRTIKRINANIEHKHNPKPSTITDFDIEQAKDYPIEELFETKLFTTNRNLTGRCPFHNSGQERTPSFTIYPNNVGHCFGCGWHGDSIAFYMALHKVKFIQAVRSLSKKI